MGSVMGREQSVSRPDPLESRLWRGASCGDVESIAALVALLTVAADEGNETAAVELNRLLSAIPAETAWAVRDFAASERLPANPVACFIPLGDGFSLAPVLAQ